MPAVLEKVTPLRFALTEEPDIMPERSKGQVLRADGSVIASLYAAGLAMANPIGTRATGPGTTIGSNLTWGFICGSTISDARRNAR